MKEQVKSTAKSIVEEAKEKGRAALYRVFELIEIKKRLLDIRENVRGAIKTSDKDIAKTALLAKGFREAGQTAAERIEAEVVYSPMVAEPQEYQYNAAAFEARGADEVKQEAAHEEVPKVREDKAR